MKGVHDVFHVSNLRKCLADETLQMPLKDVVVNEQLKFVEQPIRIEDREIRKLKRRTISLVKVWWNSKRGPEFTWELESDMRKKYPHLFAYTRGRVCFSRRGGCNIPKKKKISEDWEVRTVHCAVRTVLSRTPGTHFKAYPYP